MDIKQSLQSSPLIDIWHFVSKQNLSTIVLPDGCRDVIIRQTLSGERSCDVSELDNCAYQVDTVDGEMLTGLRFHPAARIDEKGLIAQIRNKQLNEKEQIIQVLPDHVVLDQRLNEALTVLAEKTSVYIASRSIGVSERTLERMVQGATQRSPVFWKSLARVRQSARAMGNAPEIPLAQIAADYGYADQAHMTREFKRWFGVTPSVFKLSPQLTKTVNDPGYSNVNSMV